MSLSMTISEARAALTDVVDRVLAGEEVTLTRHGVAVAVVVRPDVLAVRRAEAALRLSNTVKDIVKQGRSQSLTMNPTITVERGDELVAEIAASRSSR